MNLLTLNLRLATTRSLLASALLASPFLASPVFAQNETPHRQSPIPCLLPPQRDISVSNPLVGTAGLFPGSYTFLGGADGGADTAQDNLGSAQFSINTAPITSPVPEPASIYLLLGGLSTIAPLSWSTRE